MTVVALLLALSAQAGAPASLPFRVGCGDRYCALTNRDAEFRSTERGLSLERIGGFGPGATVTLKLSSSGSDAIDRVFSIVLGSSVAVERSPRNPSRSIGRRSLISLVEPLSRAVRIRIDNCTAPAEGEAALQSPCIFGFGGLDNAVVAARTRLRLARQRY